MAVTPVLRVIKHRITTQVPQLLFHSLPQTYLDRQQTYHNSQDTMHYEQFMLHVVRLVGHLDRAKSNY